MKVMWLVLSLLILINQANGAGSAVTSSAAQGATRNDMDNRVRQHQADFQEVKRLERGLQKMKVAIANGTAHEGSAAEIFRDSNNTVRLVRETYPTDNGRTTYEFFFKDGRLFLAIVGNAHWDKPMTALTRGDLTMMWSEERMYFTRGEGVRWTMDQTDIPLGTQKFTDRAHSLRSHAIEAWQTATEPSRATASVR